MLNIQKINMGAYWFRRGCWSKSSE